MTYLKFIKQISMKMIKKSVICQISFILLIAHFGTAQTSIIDFDKLKKADSSWTVQLNETNKESGKVIYRNEKWLMHFLHWRELNDNNRNISVEYTKEKMMSLWGMQFTLTGIEGETQVNDHKAFFVEGMLWDIVKTRFIVWNCPETNRQFISDCNINIAHSTPEKLLKLQTDDITKSIACHENHKIKTNSKLLQHVDYEEEKVSFDLPENWRSNRFIENPKSNKDKPGHYPNGMSKDRGVIWNLLSDSEKEINLSWETNKKPLSEKGFESALMNHLRDSATQKYDTLTYLFFRANIKPKDISKQKGCFETSGSFDFVTEIVGQGHVETCLYIFKAYMWKQMQTDYLLTVIMVAHDNFWGIPFDLKPTEKQFNEFEEEVLKNISKHPINNN
jgi:hypothetical protein